MCLCVVNENEIILVWRDFHLLEVFHGGNAEEGVVCERQGEQDSRVTVNQFGIFSRTHRT